MKVITANKRNKAGKVARSVGKVTLKTYKKERSHAGVGEKKQARRKHPM